ncbi:class I adenylate-forming enzyme family protein [Clostridium sp. LP20]|uniref:class I adenylate-forming enzyme family protein n=1 Tax=Clostridium sp. LP20 TaxID=3418665 RepID=UPI003EE781DD
MSLIDTMVLNKKKYATKTAIATKSNKYTYEELYYLVEKAATYLYKNGINKGDRVVITSLSQIEYVVIFLALHLLHAVTIPVERGILVDSLEYIIDVTKSNYYITSGKKKSENVKTFRYNEILQSEEKLNLFDNYKQLPNELSEIIFTTGTTGKPKGTMHNEKAIEANTNNTINGISMLSDDVILLSLPLQHSFGLRVLRSALTKGATIVLQSSAIFANETEKNIIQYKCTGFVCVSTVMEKMLQEMGEEKVKKVFQNLRYIEFSAGAVSEELRRRITNLLSNVDIYNTWGSSETGGCLFINISKRKEKINSLGKPCESCEAVLFYQDENRIIENPDHDKIGRLAIKGDMLMSGYIGREELTKRTLINGWFLTNDLVKKDNDGYFYMIGRSDDMINSGGKKISILEIEQIANMYDGVIETACIGIDDNENHLGKVPVLFLVSKETSINLEDGMKKYLLKKLMKYKMPVEYIIIDKIPRNTIGKINRIELKRVYQEKKNKQ